MTTATSSSSPTSGCAPTPASGSGDLEGLIRDLEGTKPLPAGRHKITTNARPKGKAKAKSKSEPKGKGKDTDEATTPKGTSQAHLDFYVHIYLST